MKSAGRLAVRILVLVAVISSVTIFGNLSPKGTMPYVSALADLSAIQPALAAGCAFKACNKGPGGGASCKPSGSPYNCKNVAGGCQLTAC
jgi:hypothetical protein